MTAHDLVRRTLLHGLAISVATAAIAAPPAAGEPWAKVPAFPTGYYANNDGFAEKLAGAKDAVAADAAEPRRGGELGYAPWAVKEHDALVAQRNAASEKVHGEWRSAAGPFPSWLNRYREHLIEDQIPSREEGDNVGAGFMVHLLDTPDASFKSTATLHALRESIDRV